MRRGWRVVLPVVVLGVLSSPVSGASAQTVAAPSRTIDPDDVPPRSSDPPPRIVVGGASRVWYGAPMLLIDFASITAALAGVDLAVRSLRFCFYPPCSQPSGAESAGTGLTLLGYTAFSLGAPMVHVLRGRAAEATGSILCRLLFSPLVVVGSFAATKSEVPAIALSALGLAGIAALDDVLVARGPVDPDAQSTTLRLAPQVQVGKTSVLGLVGAF
jgi:hypothetical protein